MLDPLVEVDEVGAMAMGQALADHALAAPGQADEDDVHQGPSRRRRSRLRPVPVKPWPDAGEVAVAVATGPPATGASSGAAMRARYVARFAWTSATVSPPNFSATNAASVSMTIASPTTPAAGTTLMSLRS